MTECNGCGACCDPVTLPISRGQMEALGNKLADRAWMLAHLHPIPRREGRARQPWAKGKGWSEHLDANGDPVIEAVHYYRCDRYDPVAKRCTDYNNRPTMCRIYPWADGVPEPAADLPPTCSYRADIGLAVLDGDGIEVAVAAPVRRSGEGKGAKRSARNPGRRGGRTTRRKAPNFPGKSTF